MFKKATCPLPLAIAMAMLTFTVTNAEESQTARFAIGHLGVYQNPAKWRAPKKKRIVDHAVVGVYFPEGAFTYNIRQLGGNQLLLYHKGIGPYSAQIAVEVILEDQ